MPGEARTKACTLSVSPCSPEFNLTVASQPFASLTLIAPSLAVFPIAVSVNHLVLQIDHVRDGQYLKSMYLKYVLHIFRILYMIYFVCNSTLRCAFVRSIEILKGGYLNYNCSQIQF